MTKPENISTSEPSARALLFTLQTPVQTEAEVAASLAELDHLLRGLGVDVGPRVIQQRSSPAGILVLGSGKLDELRELLERESEQTDGHLVVVYDGELTPGQQRALTRELDVEVLDRTQVILRVFAQRARTRTSQLEIEFAQLTYESPRIRDDDAIGQKQSGGGGRAAKGHTSVELRKQQLRYRLATIRQELNAAQALQKKRQLRRQQVSRVALVGYTNAGKSSWMRRLTGADAVVRDALFETLDTTLRVLHPVTTPRIVVADTVGFLRNLPNHLLASFRSTLDEAIDADLLVLVVDGSDPEWAAHLATTQDVLDQVDALGIPQLVLVNKSDLMSQEQRASIQEQIPDAVFVSSRSSDDVDAVHRRLVTFFEQALDEREFSVPFENGALRAEMWDKARVVSERCDEEGCHLVVRGQSHLLSQWQERLQRSSG